MIKNQKLYDCIPFYQSNLLFELRLHTLINIVDKFIVCEATKTHSGETKELIFDFKRFHKFRDKIKYIVVDDMPDNKSKIFDKYPLYNFQIDKLINGIKEAEDEDFIMISDEDEIPNPNVIKDYNYENFKYAIFLQNLYYYKFNIKMNLMEMSGQDHEYVKKKV
jgi:beta-1,4-mannosyl-glycoprotein beta-1,4-N-acetylglucosaminyltransferase